MVKRFKKVGIISDIHAPFDVRKNIDLALDYFKSEKVNEIVLLGDTIDFYEISSFTKDPSRMSFLQEVEYTKNLLSEMKSKFPKSVKWTTLRGNHEQRAQTYLRKNAPAFAKLPSLTVSGLLDLDKLGIDYVDNKEILGAGKQPLSRGGCFLLHGDELRLPIMGANNSRLLYTKLNGVSAIFGHTHQDGSYYAKQLDHSYKEVHNVGTFARLVEEDFSVLNSWICSFAVLQHKGDSEFKISHRVIINGDIR